MIVPRTKRRTRDVPSKRQQARSVPLLRILLGLFAAIPSTAAQDSLAAKRLKTRKKYPDDHVPFCDFCAFLRPFRPQPFQGS
jgi:hypothetical protein